MNNKNLPSVPGEIHETHDQARRRLANELRYLIQQVNSKIIELTKEHDGHVTINVHNASAGCSKVVDHTFGMVEVKYTPATKHY